MIGPSSSHTAGAVRLGLMARNILGEKPTKAIIQLHGSFSETYKGHGSDLALIGGILNFQTDDLRIKEAYEWVKKEGVEISIEHADLGDVHPNTAKITLFSDNNKIEIVGSSIGGGSIVVTELNGFPVELYGNYETIVTSHQDVPGVISKASSLLSEYDINVAFMRVVREKKGKMASMIVETDQKVGNEVIKEMLKIEAIKTVRIISKL